MPSLFVKPYILSRSAKPIDEQVGRHPHSIEVSKRLMVVYIELVEKEPIDTAIAELTFRQGNAMNHDESDVQRFGSTAPVRRSQVTNPGQPVIAFYVQLFFASVMNS